MNATFSYEADPAARAPGAEESIAAADGIIHGVMLGALLWAALLILLAR